jgi:hypothetical protein
VLLSREPIAGGGRVAGQLQLADGLSITILIGEAVVEGHAVGENAVSLVDRAAVEALGEEAVVVLVPPGREGVFVVAGGEAQPVSVLFVVVVVVVAGDVDLVLHGTDKVKLEDELARLLLEAVKVVLVALAHGFVVFNELYLIALGGGRGAWLTSRDGAAEGGANESSASKDGVTHGNGCKKVGLSIKKK